jgi:antitoxin Phd
MRIRRTLTAPLASFTATDAKNSFGSVLDRALTEGTVTITKRRRPTAVLLSMAEYEGLLARQADPLTSLRSEFDQLVARMQTPEAKVAGRKLFGASGTQLGRAARSRRQRG